MKKKEIEVIQQELESTKEKLETTIKDLEQQKRISEMHSNASIENKKAVDEMHGTFDAIEGVIARKSTDGWDAIEFSLSARFASYLQTLINKTDCEAGK